MSPDADARDTVAKWRAAVERGDKFAWDDVEREVAELLYVIEDLQEEEPW